MLVRFVVSNFMSFKEDTEFNMLTGKGNAYQKHRNHVFKTESGVDVLKTGAIYGANASGKSNLVKAIEYLKELVVYDELEFLVPISSRFRLDKKYKDLPTKFRVEYVFKGIHFDYGIEISKGKVIEEWLYKIDDVKKSKETLLFKRGKGEVDFGSYFKKKEIAYLEKFIEKELSDSQTVLNASYERVEGNDLLDIIYEAFDRLSIVTPQSINPKYTISILGGSKSKKFAEDLLAQSQTGIENLVIEEINADSFFSYEDEESKNEIIEALSEKAEEESKNIEELSVIFSKGKEFHSFKMIDGKYYVSILKTKHYSSEELFDLEEESDGTRRLFELSPAFDDLIMNKDVVYIIDELERSMHPVLAKELMKLFSQAITSSNQLIFTTHESHLLDLDIFRQDEIWFSEKRNDGSSDFYPLSDFKPREDKDIQRGYLQGRYGGIPFLGELSKIYTIDQ